MAERSFETNRRLIFEKRIVGHGRLDDPDLLLVLLLGIKTETPIAPGIKFHLGKTLYVMASQKRSDAVRIAAVFHALLVNFQRIDQWPAGEADAAIVQPMLNPHRHRQSQLHIVAVVKYPLHGMECSCRRRFFHNYSVYSNGRMAAPTGNAELKIKPDRRAGLD